MADITNALNEFKTAPNGESVRDAFVEAMTLVNNDNIKIGRDYLQVIEAAGQVGTAVSSAEASATLASTKASQASTSATTASNAALTATTKASEAATSASTANAASISANNKAGEVATSATTASNAATTATTKASEAAASASAALTAKNNIESLIATASDAAEQSVIEAAASALSASNSATIATTKAGETVTTAATVVTNATEVTNAKNIVVTKAEEVATNTATIVGIRDEILPKLNNIDQKVTDATSAATSALSSKDIAVTKATEASTSASSALESKNDAEASASSALVSMNTASSKAIEASDSATQAAASAALAGEIAGVTPETIAYWNGKQDPIGFTPENIANKGIPDGYASLGSDGKVPTAQLPTIDGHTHANKAILDKITSGTGISYDLDSFGDMKKSTYDSNQNGIVDNAEKVNGHTVESDVPALAIFTDTTTTINGKTGVIAKEDIVALGIPAQDTTYSPATTSIDGLQSATDKTKLDGIDANAKNTTVTDYPATITTTWTGTDPRTQTISVSGITADDKPIVDMVPTGIYATDIAMLTDWSNIYRIVTGVDSITVYSKADTTAVIPINLRVIRQVS